MSKIFKKMVVMLAMMLVLSLLFAACGSGGSTEGTTTTGESSATVQVTTGEPTIEKLEPVDISWYLYQPDPGPGLADVEKAVNDYLKDSLNITLKIYTLAYDEFITKTNAMAAANEPFDVMYSPGWIGYEDSLHKNMYLDITEMFEKYCTHIKADTKPEVLDNALVDGKRYTVPVIQSDFGFAFGIIVNKDLADKYGFDINSINKMSDVEPMLKIIKEKNLM